MRSVGKLILILLLVLALGVVVVIVMTGLMPGVSGLVGADRPRDLGVRASQDDYDRAVREVEELLHAGPENAGPAAGGAPRAFDMSFTEAELSALLAYAAEDEVPVTDPQVKIHADGTLEVALGLSKEALPPEALESLPRALPQQVPLYIKGRLDLAGQAEVRLEVLRAEVGRFPIPLALLGPDGTLGLMDTINQSLREDPSLKLDRLTFSEGQMRLEGSYLP